MHNAGEKMGHKQFTNYLDLIPVDPLSKIIFYLPETDRRFTIAKMPEFKGALLRHDAKLRNISQQAVALVKEDKDFKAASALVQKHRRLLTEKFCKMLAKWMYDEELSLKTNALAEMLYDYAKEIDSTCTVGTLSGDVSETVQVDGDGEDSDDIFDWIKNDGEYYASVIWIRFGSVTVHYWLKPSRTLYGDEALSESVKVELNVYKHISAGKYIRGIVRCKWKDCELTYDRGYEIRSLIKQYGAIENSEEIIIEGTAIGLAAGVGMWSPASAVAHGYFPNTLIPMENIACALRFAGRSFKSLTTGKYYDVSKFMDVMC
jgi:hypothetical protein